MLNIPTAAIVIILAKCQNADGRFNLGYIQLMLHSRIPLELKDAAAAEELLSGLVVVGGGLLLLVLLILVLLQDFEFVDTDLFVDP